MTSTRCPSTTRGRPREDPRRLLPDDLGDPVHARHGRRADAQERVADLHVGRAPVERREPLARRILTAARRPHGPGPGVLLDGGRCGRGRRRARDHRGDLPPPPERRRGRRARAAMVSVHSSALWLIPALPLAAAGINLFWGRRLGRYAGWLASGAVIAAFLVSLGLVSQ